ASVSPSTRHLPSSAVARLAGGPESDVSSTNTSSWPATGRIATSREGGAPSDASDQMPPGIAMRRTPLRSPATVVGTSRSYFFQPRLVGLLDAQVAPEVLERDLLLALILRGLRVAEVPDLVRPRLELEVVRDTALHRYRLVLRGTGRLVRTARVGALAILDERRGPLQRAHLA